MERSLPVFDIMSQRQTFIQQFFKEIKDINYVLLKFIEGKIDAIDDTSDLDCLLDEKALPFIRSVVQNAENLLDVDAIDLPSMTQFFLYFQDGSFLQIDCLFRLVRKNLVYLPNDYVQSNITKVDGVKTYEDKCLFEHLMLFHQLNNDGLPAKYLAYFNSLPKSSFSQIIEDFNQKYNANAVADNLTQFDPSLQAQLKEFLWKLPYNSFSQKIKNSFSYYKETLQRFWKSRGKVITFSGVDGAGKSTILAETKQMLEKKFRKKVVVLRHRPSLLPILSSIKHGKKGAEKRAAEKMPRQGTNKSSIGSLMRFSYYYLDYFFGQWYIFFRYEMMNYIVLYDRYYFDFIVDGKRSNIQLNSSVTKGLYRFVHKPQLNFFLYASPQVILKRKKELSAEDITTLTTNYQDLFANFSDRYSQRYLPIKNIDKSETLQLIQKEIQHIL